MKLRFPYLLFYTDSKPEGHAGFTTGPVIRICKDYKDDIGLEKHEAFHVYQWWIGLGILHPILYSFVKPYRLWSEVQAYKRQLNYPPATSDREAYKQAYAEFISTKYGLDITKEKAYELLG